jgi:hypothetical protein
VENEQIYDITSALKNKCNYMADAYGGTGLMHEGGIATKSDDRSELATSEVVSLINDKEGGSALGDMPVGNYPTFIVNGLAGVGAKLVVPEKLECVGGWGMQEWNADGGDEALSNRPGVNAPKPNETLYLYGLWIKRDASDGQEVTWKYSNDNSGGRLYARISDRDVKSVHYDSLSQILEEINDANKDKVANLMAVYQRSWPAEDDVEASSDVGARAGDAEGVVRVDSESGVNDDD